MPTIAANDLKTKGIAAIEAALAGQSEAVISVRGKGRFVVMDFARMRARRSFGAIACGYCTIAFRSNPSRVGE